MTLDIVLLALASTIRPTSLAAVYALLSQPNPRRLMSAYVATGLLATIAFGALVVLVFGGIEVGAGTDRAKAIVHVAGGVLVLALGVVVLRRGAEAAPRPPARWAHLLDRRPGIKTAALAGPVTHIPGVLYLVALNIIVGHDPSVLTGLVEIVIYNVIWFTLPILALAVCIVQPATARDGVGAVDAWARRHARTIVLAVAFTAGTVLVVRGLLMI